MRAAGRIASLLALGAALAILPAAAASAAPPRVATMDAAGVAHEVTWKKKGYGWYGGKHWHGRAIPYGYTYVRPWPERYIYRYHPYVYERPYVRVRPYRRHYYYGHRYGRRHYRW